MTLTELKRAIEKVEHYNALPLHQQLDRALAGTSRERDAWKAYALLLERSATAWSTTDATEGMRLVAEKLR